MGMFRDSPEVTRRGAPFRISIVLNYVLLETYAMALQPPHSLECTKNDELVPVMSI